MTDKKTNEDLNNKNRAKLAIQQAKGVGGGLSTDASMSEAAAQSKARGREPLDTGNVSAGLSTDASMSEKAAHSKGQGRERLDTGNVSGGISTDASALARAAQDKRQARSNDPSLD